jgi:histidyl-tRNA synthetase
MNQEMQTLKGFRDFIGYDAQKRMWLIEKIRGVFSAFGFEPLETPVLEYASLLLGKYGDEAEKLIYMFEDRGGRKVAMRYDQTVPTARIISQYQNTLIFPYKRYQIQPVWRADKPQKGRYREFFQCDADIIGSTSYIADAEILAVYYAIYEAIGLTSIKIQVNDRQQLIQTVKAAGAEDDNVLSIIQTIDKIKKISVVNF